VENGLNYTQFSKGTYPWAQIYFISEHAARISFAADGTFSEALFANDVLLPHAKIAGSQKGDQTASYGQLNIAFDEPANTMQIFSDTRNFLSFRAYSTTLEIDTRPGEGFYGFGEWFNGFRRTRDRLIIHNQESPAFTQHKHTYSAFPVFLSDQGYLIFVLNSHRGEAGINTTPGKLKLEFEGGNLDLVVIYGPSFKKILSEYTALTGRPPLLPMWSFGLWNTAYPVENQPQTLKRIHDHRTKKMPLDAIILDYHWQEGFSNFKWRNPVFPDPDAMIREMQTNNIKPGLIYTPYINNDTYPLYKMLVRLYVKNNPDAVAFISRDYAKDMYAEGMKEGYFAHPRVTWWFGRGGAVDFTNPEAVKWWFDRQKALLDQGVYFFKNDGGEYLPEDATSHIGLDPKEYHNIYGFYYTRALFEKCREYHANRRPLVFSRTNWAGTQRYPATFLGDQTPTFKHIAATMRCGLNMSLLGFAYWGADVLALYKKPSAELHRRYSQWSLFSPIARYFSKPGDDSRNPWGINRECEENFRRHVNLRMQLLPYFYQLAREAYDSGIPIIRPLILEFQDDEETKHIWRQLMLGDRLMLAPVLESNIHHQPVYFPQGTWYSWWDDAQYQGPGWHDIVVSNDHLPLFARGGYPIILGPVIQSIPDNHRFNVLEVHFYPPFVGEASLYEDDGTTLNYQSKKCSFQKIKCSQDECEIKILIEPAEGMFTGQPQTRRLSFILHKITAFQKIMMNGTLLSTDIGRNENYTFEQTNRILTIETAICVQEKVEFVISLSEKHNK